MVNALSCLVKRSSFTVKLNPRINSHVAQTAQLITVVGYRCFLFASFQVQWSGTWPSLFND